MRVILIIMVALFVIAMLSSVLDTAHNEIVAKKALVKKIKKY